MIIKKKKGSTETLSALVGVIIFTIVAIAIAMLVYNYLIIPSGLQKTLDSIGEKIDIIRDGEMLTIAGNSGPPLDYFFFGFDADKDYFGLTRDEMDGWFFFTRFYRCTIDPKDLFAKYIFYTEIKKPKMCGNNACICFCPKYSSVMSLHKDMCNQRKTVCKILDPSFDLKFGGYGFDAGDGTFHKETGECEFGPFIASRHSNVIEFNIQRFGDAIGICQYPPCLIGYTRPATQTINHLFEEFLKCRSYNETDCYCGQVHFYYDYIHTLNINTENENLIFRLSDRTRVISSKEIKDTKLCFADEDYNPTGKTNIELPTDITPYYFTRVREDIARFSLYKSSSNEICFTITHSDIHLDKPSCSGKMYNENLNINKAIFIDWIKKESYQRGMSWYGLVDLLYRSKLWYFFVLEDQNIPDYRTMEARKNYLNELYNYKNLDLNNNSLIGDESVYIGINSYKINGNDKRKIDDIKKDYIEIIYNPASTESEKLARMVKNELEKIKGKHYVGFQQPVSTDYDTFKIDIEILETIVPDEHIKRDVWMFCDNEHYSELKACSNQDHVLMPAIFLNIVNTPDGRDIETHGYSISKAIYDGLIKYLEEEKEEVVSLVPQ